MEQAAFEKTAHDLMNQAVVNYHKHGQVDPTGLVITSDGTTHTYEMTQYVRMLGEQMGKLAFSTMIRTACQELEAELAAVIMETWMASLNMEAYPEYDDALALQQALYEKYGSMQSWPKEMRTSAIIVSLEHRDGRQLYLILPFDDETGEFGEMMEPPKEVMGTLTNWFAKYPRAAATEVS